MSDDRIKELQDFAEDFKKKLRYAKEKYENSLTKSMDDELLQAKGQPRSDVYINTSPRRLKHKQVIHKFLFTKIYHRKKTYSNLKIHGYQIIFLVNH